MAKRKLVKRKVDRKIFETTAKKIHKKNLAVDNPRGGIRL